MIASADISRPVGVPRLLSFAFILGAFALGTSENVIAGILPRLSEALDVPISDVGLLVTAYAGTAVILGPVLALMTARMPLRTLTIAAMTIYAGGTVLAAAAPTYPVLMVSRIITGSMHTPVLVAFMLTALRLSREGERGRTVGRITLGLGVATVIGVPVGNALSETLGWQWAFALIAALIGATLIIVVAAFPDDRSARGETGWRSLRVLTRAPVAGGVAMTALAGFGAMALLAFAVPFLTSTGIDDRAVAPLLLLHGAACLAGNVIGGKFADRGLGRALTLSLGSTGLALLVAGLIGGSVVGAVAGLALVGITYSSTFPPLNTWIATSAEGIAPDLALAVNSSAFNIGIAAAGWVGGAALAAGHRAAHLPYLGIGALMIAVVISLLLRHIRKAPAAYEADTALYQ
ncbi:MFS transporter [Rhodococcus sp. IEGM 1409]|uniref:MFS transporter n=1 Tax=Rhodococcus sp. IEGM 1409 TaxID=3047082 RepID=UPI0024B6A9AA|nr:MFS transporter [Rhodococcus sp. IEGM 1409]MDI9900329.1 MFS transporter [Rhodococcus sp. IEGM 1409]